MQLYWAKEAFSEVVQFSYPRAQPPCDVGNAIDVLCAWNVTDLIAAATNMIYNSTQPWGTPVPCFTAFQPSSAAVDGAGGGPTLAPVAPRPAGPGQRALANAAAAAGRGANGEAVARGRRLGSLPIQTIPWDYLCCTEIVQPIAGRGIFSFPAPYDLNAISASCKERYGVTPDPQWHRTYILDPLSNATNIVFSNGGYDPVRGFDPATNLAPTLIAIDIAECVCACAHACVQRGCCATAALTRVRLVSSTHKLPVACPCPPPTTDDSMAHTFDLFATQAGDPANVVKARKEEWEALSKMLYGPGGTGW